MASGYEPPIDEEEDPDDHPHDREPAAAAEADEGEEDEEPEEDWGYRPGYLIHTPSAWGNMYPLCDEVENQSPIDVSRKHTEYTPDLQ